LRRRGKLEGVIAKRTDRPYRSGRTEDWLKLKCVTEQEFVVIGYTLSDSPGRPFASLLLATRDGDGRLLHVGRVGTGWDEREMIRLAKLLLPLRTEKAPVDRVLPGQVRREIRWIKPELVAQVGYAEITREGALRHPRYVGLREDKAAHEVQFEQPTRLQQRPAGSRVTSAGGDAMPRRELIDTGTDKRYVRRSPTGTFKESDDQGKSLAADRRTKAKTVAKKGQGDKGDHRRR
jgi:bifunctional non-homologous end joining protein LigD